MGGLDLTAGGRRGQEPAEKRARCPLLGPVPSHQRSLRVGHGRGRGPPPTGEPVKAPRNDFYLSPCDAGVCTKMSRGRKPSGDDTQPFPFFLVLTRLPGLGSVSCCPLRGGHREHERGLTGLLTQSGERGAGVRCQLRLRRRGASPPPGLPHRPRPSWIRRGRWAPRPAGGPCSGWPTAGYRRRSAARQQSGGLGDRAQPPHGRAQPGLQGHQAF